MRGRPLLLTLLLLLCACGDDGSDVTAEGDAAGDANGADDGTGDGADGDPPAAQEGGAVAADDDAPMDIADPEPDAGAAPPPDAGAAPFVDEVDGDDAFDLETCKDVVFDPETGQRDPRCGECCMLRAYTLARFVFEQTCACADRPAFEDASVCATSTAAPDCSSCCEDAGFELGSTADGGCSCTREPISDAQVCDVARGQDDPVIACEACCLEAGLLGFTFTAGDDGECRCLEPG